VVTLTRIRRLVDDVGFFTALLHVAGRTLSCLGHQAALHDLVLFAQPVRATPQLPAGRGASIEVRSYSGQQALDAGLPCPAEHAVARRGNGMHCLAAYREGRLIAFQWVNLGSHQDELVRARYVPMPEGRSAWSFDMHVDSAHRGGLAFARLTDATWALLRAHGRTEVASYILASNRGAIGAEQRLGGRRLGRAVHLRLGPLQLLIASLPPYLHLSASDRGAPVMRVGDGSTS